MSSVDDRARPMQDAVGLTQRLASRAWLIDCVRAYASLMKLRIVELLLVTTVPAMLLAQRGVPPVGLIIVVLIGGSLAAGAANALNCYIDRDIDQLMRRTKRRPLPQHALQPQSVLVFGLVLAVVFWQMPHFYALAIVYKDDYARAGIPMLPVVRSAARVNREILLFTYLTV